MIVRTLLFKTWQLPSVPSRLVLNDDGLMKHNRGDTSKTQQRHAKASAATYKKVVTYIEKHPWCTYHDVMAGVGMSKSVVHGQLRNLMLDNKVHVRKEHAGQSRRKCYKLKEST